MPNRWLVSIFVLASIALNIIPVNAQNNANDNFSSLASDSSYPTDPYLSYQPAFGRSLPVQILITGMALTLSCVLMLNLLFTLQFHWPISHLNYLLQLCGLSSMLVVFIIDFHVILTSAAETSKMWPYMLDYVAVDVPPADWSDIGVAWWYGLIALTTGFVHITHIQFLAMLYPSNLEAKLILTLLGPLALLSAITELIPMHTRLTSSSSPSPLVDITDSIQSICNSTLTLLYTISLLAWGFLVNRKQAWRLEGGTAAFGGTSLLLAVLSTTLAFLQTSALGATYVWARCLRDTVVVWQNFIVWWWWVGAGMNDDTYFEDNYKSRDRRNQAKTKTKTRAAGVRGSGSKSEAESVSGSTAMRGRRLWNRRTRSVMGDVAGPSSHPHTLDIPPSPSQDIQIQSAPSSPLPHTHTSSPTSAFPFPLPLAPPSSSSSSTNPKDRNVFSQFWHTLRRAHRSAVHKQTVERIVMQRRRMRGGEDMEVEVEDEELETEREVDGMDVLARQTIERRERERERERGVAAGASPLWWGPFSRWRLRDRTVY